MERRMLRLGALAVGLVAALVLGVGAAVGQSVAGGPAACVLAGTCMPSPGTAASAPSGTPAAAVANPVPATAQGHPVAAPAPVEPAPAAQQPAGSAAAAADPAPGPGTAALLPAPLSILVPSCGEPADVLCQVPGTNVFAHPGTLYDPQTQTDAPIPAMPASYHRYLCRVENVRPCPAA